VTPLIVVILAVAWIVVLAPPLLRSRADGRPSASVGSFRQQLATLSRTAPERRGVRNRSLNTVPTRATGRSGVPRLAAVPRYEADYDEGYDGTPGVYRVGRQAPRPVRAGRPMGMGYPGRSPRADIRRRRQNVLVALLAIAAVTAIGGFGLGIGPMVGINLLVDALLVFYVYLLVQLRRAEEDRAMRTSWSKAA
jgi:hypothetical protein